MRTPSVGKIKRRELFFPFDRRHAVSTLPPDWVARRVIFSRTTHGQHGRKQAMSGDWIKLHRKLIDSRVFADAKTLRVWVWCLCRATYRERHYNGGTLQPGQFVTGRHSAAAELGIPPSTFLRRLERLVEWEMIRIYSTNQYSIVTVLNWSNYQHDDGGNSNGESVDPTNRNPPQRREIPADEIDEFVAAWNAVDGLSPVRVVTDSRRAKCRTRLANESWPWRDALTMLPLPSNDPNAWQPDFDWFIRNNENALSIIEGKYNWRKSATRGSTPQPVRLKT